jgi:isoleucyl-tRNA synthetase
MKALAGTIATMNQDDIRQLEQSGSFTLTLEGEEITLEKDDFQITSEDVPGWLVAHDGDLTVALDITLTDELRQEGLARDAVNRIQNLRKDAGLEVQDKIQITFHTEDAFLQTALEAHADYICRETQALGLQANGAAQGEELELEGASVRLAIEKQ